MRGKVNCRDRVCVLYKGQGMVSGGVMAFVWKYAIRPLGGIFDIYELLPAFLISFVAIVIVSLLTKAPSQEIMDEFEKAKGIIK